MRRKCSGQRRDAAAAGEPRCLCTRRNVEYTRDGKPTDVQRWPLASVPNISRFTAANVVR